MTECEYCRIAEKKMEAKKIFEDNKVIAILSEKPASLGHIIVFPKQHFPIIENIPDHLTAHIFQIVNKLSIAVFDSLGAQGTNIIVNNGVSAGQDKAHFCVHIIPRKENDNLGLTWETKHLDEEQMSTIELNLKEETKNIGEFEKEAPTPKKADIKKETISGDENKENYLIKQIQRIP